MLTAELNFHYPQELVATEPSAEFRCMSVDQSTGQQRELNKTQVLEQFQRYDVLVINNTKVLKSRVFSDCGLEILFANQINQLEWEVLFPAKKVKIGQCLKLPNGVTATLVKKDIPQTIKLSKEINLDWFEQFGELALPPYIQKARDQRHNLIEDSRWYQTAWASQSGSSAAPTASLHFSLADLCELKNRGVEVCELTLHVGLGTFLPIQCDHLTEHKMHSEYVSIPEQTITKVKSAKKVWALGTTVARSLEAYARGDFEFNGQTDIFIKPGFEFKVVDRLLTNFHQPKSTLIALVAAFAGIDLVKESYKWAIDKNFRLFSYGDLTLWM